MKIALLHIILILNIIISPNNIFGENNKIDSLKLLITTKNLNNDKFLKLAKQYSYFNNDSTIKYCNVFIQNSSEDSISENIVKAYLLLGIANINIGNYNKAFNYLNLGFSIAKKHQYKELEMELLYNLSEMYKARNDYKNSLIYLEQYYNINDSLFDKEKAKQISELNIKYKTIKKDKEISLLNKDKVIQEERYKMQNKLMILLSIIIIVILIFASIILLFNKRQYTLYKNLVKKNIELLNKDDIIVQNKNNQTYNNNITKEKQIEYTTIDDDKKYIYSKLDKSLVIEISTLVTKALEKDKIYLDSGLSISKMAEYLNINRTYLSQIINGYFKKNFSTFINEYRIKDAQKQLLSNNKITIEAISKQVGFNSKSAFNTAFKNYTGVTPSFFIKNSKS